MNRLFITLILFFSILNTLHAEGGFIKYNKNCEYRNKTVFCFKGEIFPYINSNKNNKINIIIGKDTLVDIDIESKDFRITPNPNNEYFVNAPSYAKLKDNDLIFIDAKSISPKDTVTLFSESGKKITQLILERETSVKKSECGKLFRLIITNAPTIFYPVDQLLPYVPPAVDTDGDEVLDVNDLCPDVPGLPLNNGCPDDTASFKWWYYLIILVILAGIVYLVWELLFNRILFRKSEPNGEISNKEPIVVIYDGKQSLHDFAKNNNTVLRKLIKMNDKTIDQNYVHQDSQGRKRIQDKLKGKNLVVGYQTFNKNEAGNSLVDNNQSDNSDNFEVTNREEKNNTDEPLISSMTESSDIISQKLKQLENNLIREIRNVNSKGNDNSNELNGLKRQLEGLKNENIKFEAERKNLDSKITQLQIEKDELSRNLQSSNSDKNKIVSDLSQLQEKVIDVDYLIGYCESVLAYLNLCKQVTKDAYDLFYRIGQQDVEQGFAIGQLLLTFQSSINSIPLGNWMQIVLEINDSGVTSSKQIKNSFKQLDNDEEKRKQFQRLLFSEVLIKYSSTILILAEAFRNLAHFQITSELINEAENLFGKYVSELLNKVKSSGLENKYVPLFKNFEEFLGQIESVDSETSYAYNRVTGIVKDSIAEIVSYGVKTSFEETKTLIILK